jgi:predicted nucleotidyltransferase component of viral defense system
MLSKIQRRILGIFPNISDNEYFYLTGGTALSYFYLKHRKSNDLDFFTTTEEIILPFSYRLEEILKEKGVIVQRQRGLHSFVELLVEEDGDKTIIHLAYDSPFRFENLKEFSEFPKLKVDSLINISVNKLLALFGRASLRDFIDIYFLIKKKMITKEELLSKAKIKDPGFDVYWLGIALERINTFDKDSPDMLLLLEKIDFNEFIDFFNQWRKEIAENLI